MNAPLPPPASPLHIPPLDAIRAEIDATDERARLLRRLLRVAILLDLSVTAGDAPAVPPAPRPCREVARA